MFEATVIALLEGKFICRVAHLDLFAFLQDEEKRRQVDAYLSQIGRRLIVTAGNKAFYAGYRTVGSKERSQVRLLFKEIKYEIRPVLEFLNLVLQTQRADQTLDTGDAVYFSKTLTHISENAHLEKELQRIVNLGREFAASDASSRSLLDKLFQQMVKLGYLVPDHRGDRFDVTGKVDYFYEVILFLSENERDIQEAQATEPENETGSLF